MHVHSALCFRNSKIFDLNCLGTCASKVDAVGYLSVDGLRLGIYDAHVTCMYWTDLKAHPLAGLFA